jgi:diguanylate cyclase (GGDEF)-like protein
MRCSSSRSIVVPTERDTSSERIGLTLVAQLNIPRPIDAPSYRALVIEDDSSLSGVVRDVLNSVGCADVRFISSGVEALRVAKALGPDLVLLDLGLPDIDGLEVCRQLSVLLPSVPVVIITARSDDSVIQVAFEAGAQDYVAKPFRLGELAARARAALNLRSERLLRSRRESELAAQARRLEETTRELERMVHIDALTGVANRGHFDELLRSEWNRASRPGSPLSLVIVDVDDFHAFNEHYSHLGGDSALKDVTAAMANCLRRPSDVLARYGGEEFVALLPDTEAAGACVVAERLRAAVEDLGIEHARSRCAKVVTISAGVATMAPSLDRPPTALVSAADAALFRAKDSGRNRWCTDADVPGQVVVSRRPWPVGPVVRADPYMAQHIPRFLENRRVELISVREAARVGDLTGVKAFGHKLKGSGGTFGFDALSVLGERLEQSATDADRTELLRVVDEIGWYLDHVQVVYRRTSASITAQLVEQT